MEYVQNMQSWNQKRVDPNLRCNKACTPATGRTATCKFDGSCTGWSEHVTVKEERREQYHHEKSKKRNLMKGLSGGRV